MQIPLPRLWTNRKNHCSWGARPPKRPCRCLQPLSPHQKRCESMSPETHPHVLPSLRYHSSGTVLQVGSPDRNVGFLMSGKGVGAEAAPQRRISHRNHQPLPTLRGHPLCIGQGIGVLAAGPKIALGLPRTSRYVSTCIHDHERTHGQSSNLCPDPTATQGKKTLLGR